MRSDFKRVNAWHILMRRWASGGPKEEGQGREEHQGDAAREWPNRGRTQGRQSRNGSGGSRVPCPPSEHDSFTRFQQEDGAEVEWERYRSACSDPNSLALVSRARYQSLGCFCEHPFSA